MSYFSIPKTPNRVAIWKKVREHRKAEEYIRQELKNGTSLAHVVLRRVDFLAGRFRVAIPETLDEKDSREYRHHVSGVGNDGEYALAHTIKSFLTNTSSETLLQDTQFSASDVRNSSFVNSADCFSLGQLAVCFGEEVYWLLTGSRLSGVSDSEIVTIINA